LREGSVKQQKKAAYSNKRKQHTATKESSDELVQTRISECVCDVISVISNG
jgi:hypothetical protein